MTNVIKIKFVRGGVVQEKEYCFYAPPGMELAVGDNVAIEVTKGIVTQVDVPEEEIAPFADRAKTIIGKLPEAADVPQPS
jgi:hypothetical protein